MYGWVKECEEKYTVSGSMSVLVCPLMHCMHARVYVSIACVLPVSVFT